MTGKAILVSLVDVSGFIFLTYEMTFAPLTNDFLGLACTVMPIEVRAQELAGIRVSG